MTVNTAAKHAATTTATTSVKRHRTVELPAGFGPLFDELADVKLTLAEAKARHDELTDIIKAEAGMNEDKKETLLVRVGGVLRAKIGLRGRTNISAKDLQAGFPEAFEACSSESEYQVVTPA